MNSLLANALVVAFENSDRTSRFLLGVLTLVLVGGSLTFLRTAVKATRLRAAARRFSGTYRAIRDPLDPALIAADFSGVPTFEAFRAGAEAWTRHGAPGSANRRNRSLLKLETSRKVLAAIHQVGEKLVQGGDRTISQLNAMMHGGVALGLLGIVWGATETLLALARVSEAGANLSAATVSGSLLAVLLGLLVVGFTFWTRFLAVEAIRALNREFVDFQEIYTADLDRRVIGAKTPSDEVVDALRPLVEEIIDAVRRLQQVANPGYLVEAPVADHDLALR